MKKILLLLVFVSLFAFVGCKKKDEKVIRVGASSTPHAVILEYIKDKVEAKGYKLEIVEFEDYILPNVSLTEGDLDANYFQHTPYLNSYNASNGTDLESAYLVHYEPFGIYSETVKNLSDVKSGATIFIPADESNETRALLLLRDVNLITLKDGVNINTGVTTFDILDNKGFVIKEVEASTLVAQLKNATSGSLAVINGNYAIQAGYKVKDSLALESSESDAAQTYANIIAVRKGESDNEKIKVLIECLNNNDVKEFIERTFNGSVVPIFKKK